MQRAAVPGKCILRGPPLPESRKLKQNVAPLFKELEDLSPKVQEPIWGRDWVMSSYVRTRLRAFFFTTRPQASGRGVKSFGGNEDGVVAVIFALVFSAVFLMAAIAIDYGRTEAELVRVQNAVDSAALAASHRLGMPDQDVSGHEKASAFFKANISKHPNIGTLTSTVLDADNGEVYAKAKGNMLTSLLRAVGIHNIDFKVNSNVRRGKGTVEVALVLDNSGSMAGTYIADLRTAAENLVNVVYTGFEGTDKVKIGVVPFAASVNVGSAHADATWMDTKGLSPIHHENFAEPRTRFQLFKDIGVAWRGCVEVRPAPHNVKDSAPSEDTPSSLFVPMFNPDEPDSANDGGDSYGNSYIPDYGGTCPAPPPTCLKYNSKGNCSSWSTPPVLKPADAQSRVCKYPGASVDTSAGGPNYLCDSRPIQPLTKVKDDVITLIKSMEAKGGTNIMEGIMWGWRVLSPEPPFTEGRPYEDDDNDKFLIVMTDGENWHQARSNHNKSSYHAFGYAAKGRLGSTYTTSALVTEMSTRTQTACTNAKAKGIKIFTIAFRLESNPTTTSLLANCATGAAQAYVASDGTALIRAFESIGREIARVRVAG
jgi:Flp pilus assembly protein TadG